MWKKLFEHADNSLRESGASTNFYHSGQQRLEQGYPPTDAHHFAAENG